MKHFGSVNAKTVEIDCWLTIDPGNGATAWNRRPSVRVSAGEPKADRRERSINLRMSLPLALFETPLLTASIVVGEPSQSMSIDTAAVAEAVRQVVGMDVRIEVGMPEADHG